MVTGANIGLGYDTARLLASKDYTVIMACRNPKYALKAQNKILAENKNAKTHILNMDLSSMKSIREAAKEFQENFDRLDILVNNAGVMMPPYSKTEDGFELQWGVNYVGHFLLTGLLLDKLKSTPDSRVVTLSSLAHDWGEIYFDDLNFEKKYVPRKGYGQSKLACLVFAYELDRRFKKEGLDIKSMAAHPGVSVTHLTRGFSGFAVVLLGILAPIFFQSSAKGALPIIRAALDPDLKGGEYLGPNGFREMKGKPVIVESNELSKNEELGKKLWKVTEEQTEFQYLNGEE